MILLHFFNFKKKKAMNKKIKLSTDFYIDDYQLFEEEQNKEGIANFIFKRLSERYLIPLENVPPGFRNGFSLMANACLLIETYESFWQGWDDTSSKERRPFESFFNREERFKDFKNEYSRDFYVNVRCAILHQGETKNGWRITREKDAPLFNKTEKSINAAKFFEDLRKSLEAYRDFLITSDWNDEVWVNCRKKISYIIQNCE
jgi:hypothetical protein